tara:strand:+ start:3343 stop:3573 length:231 start_codon:yes stop_codon:yes gene_type:complete
MDARSKLVDMVEEGLLDPVQFAIMVAKWMTNDDIEEMLWANEIDIREEEEDDDGEDGHRNVQVSDSYIKKHGYKVD